MDGILGIDKPAGLTSFDVVARMRRASREKRIGHTGTLDPEATGVLVICMGAATRLSSRLTESTKSYSAGLSLGRSTDTADAWGRTIREEAGFILRPAELISCLASFQGEILQVPPMFSALKVGGRKLYDMARNGEQVERAARKVTISSISANIPPDKAELKFGDVVEISVECSAGTYIRTLCEDIGKCLGIPSHMSSLRRTYASGFAIEQCLKLEQAEKIASSGELRSIIIPIEKALPLMPRVMLEAFDANRACMGNEILYPGHIDSDEAMLIGPSGEAIAIALADTIPADNNRTILRPRVVFRSSEEVFANGAR